MEVILKMFWMMISFGFVVLTFICVGEFLLTKIQKFFNRKNNFKR